MIYYAHSGTPGNKSDWQTMPDHALAVAQGAACFAAAVGLEKAAFVEGLLHDLGKYDPAFPPRLEGANVRVDHSTAGAAVLSGLVQGDADRLMAELCGYAILGHHAGLPDKASEFANCFRRRVASFENRLDPVWKQELTPEASGLMPADLLKAIQADRPHAAFGLSVVARFLFSCLVDADFKDTERHYAGLENRRIDREWAALQDLLGSFIAAFDAKVASLPKEGEVNGLRGEILDHVRSGAALQPGLFTLTVWGRGSKRGEGPAVVEDDLSPPMRRRGSKRPLHAALPGEPRVVPPCGGVDRNASHQRSVSRTAWSPPRAGA